LVRREALIALEAKPAHFTLATLVAVDLLRDERSSISDQHHPGERERSEMPERSSAAHGVAIRHQPPRARVSGWRSRRREDRAPADVLPSGTSGSRSSITRTT